MVHFRSELTGRFDQCCIDLYLHASDYEIARQCPTGWTQRDRFTVFRLLYTIFRGAHVATVLRVGYSRNRDVLFNRFRVSFHNDGSIG